MKRMTSLVIFFIAFPTMLIMFPVVALSDPIGTFTYIKGRVDITAPGMKAVPAHKGDDVNVGDIIRTKSNSKAEIALIDGSTLRFAQKSRVKINEYMVEKKQARGILKLFRGKIQNIVKTAGKTFGRKRLNRYEVHTPTAVCGVRGTNFFVFHQRNISGAIFKKGSGYGYSVNRPDVVKTIKAGQAMIVISPDQPPVIKPATDLELEQHAEDTAPSEEEEEAEEEKEEEAEAVEEEAEAEKETAEEEAVEEEEVSEEEAPVEEGEVAEEAPAEEIETAEEAAPGPEEAEAAPEPAPTPTAPEPSVEPDAEFISESFVDIDLGSLDADIADTLAVEAVTIDTVEVPEPYIPPETPTEGVTTLSSDLSPSSFPFLTDGILSGSINDTTNAGTVQVSGTADALPVDPWSGEITGSMSDEGAFSGYFMGVSGTWEGLISSIYVTGTGAGYISGSLSGAYDSDTKTLSGSGPATRTSILGNTAITPDSLDSELVVLGSVDDSDVEGYPIPVFSSMATGSAISSAGDVVDGELIGIPTESGGKLGVWSVTTSDGTYSNDGNLQTWSGMYGQYGQYDDSTDFYMLGSISGTDDLAGHLSIDGDLTYMDHEFLGSIGLNYRGVYDAGEVYQSIGSGTYTLDPLAFTGYWDGVLWYNNNGNMDWAGEEYGLIGGLSSSWDGPVEFLAMGEYSYSTGCEGKEHYLWNAQFEGFSAETEEEIEEFMGLTGGIWKNGAMEGTAVALYYTLMDAESNFITVGSTTGDVSGLYYPDLEMWMAEGTLTPSDTQIEFDLSSIYGGEGYIESRLSGNFYEGAGSILSQNSDEEAGYAIFIADYDTETTETSHLFGIYDLMLGYNNTYSGKPSGDTTWSASVGGNLGLEHDDGAENNGYGYWLADAGGDWTGEGEITGSLDGTFLTSIYTGSVEGSFYGINIMEEGSGTWIGESIGTFTGEPLKFVSDIGSAPGNFYFYDGVDLVSGGSLADLMGGTQSLWTATASVPTGPSVPFTLMGEYNEDYSSCYTDGSNYYIDTYLGGRDPSHIFYKDIFSHNYISGEDTTYDGGAYTGYFGGSHIENNLQGIIYALYIDPSGNAGYLKGSFADTTCQDTTSIGMLHTNGLINPVQKAANTGISPDNLNSNLYQDSGTVTLAGVFEADAGSITSEKSYFNTTSIVDRTNLIAQPWGIYSAKLGGTFENLQSANTWTSMVGGSADFGAYYNATVECGDSGYFLGQTPGTGTWKDGMISADLSGSFITQTKMGSITGQLLGTYSDPANSTGPWQAASLGTWEGEELAFVSEISGSLGGGTFGAYEGEIENSLTVELTWGAEPEDLDSHLWVPSLSEGDHYHVCYYDEGSAEVYPFAWLDTDDTDGNGPEIITIEQLLSGRYYYSVDNYSEYPAISTSGAQVVVSDGSNTYTYNVPLTGAGLWWNVFLLEDNKIFTIDAISEYSAYEGGAENATGSYTAIMGGTASLWGADPAPVTFIGTYSTLGGTEKYLFRNELFSFNYKNSSYTTYDGGAYYGWMGGRIVDEVEGKLYALYVDPSVDGASNAGVLKCGFSGSTYPEIGMWEADSTISRTQMAADTGITPEELYGSIWKTSGFGEIAGLSISGSDIFSTMAIINNSTNEAQPWGIYFQRFIGAFEGSGPGDDWTAKMGGYDSFGAYYDESSGFLDDTGYWIADIEHGLFNADKLSADLNGTFLTLAKSGDINGEILGTYTEAESSNTWQAVGTGTWEGTPLTFSSSFGGNTYRTVGGTAYESGWFDGYMGGLDDLWTASASDGANIRFIGQHEGWHDDGAMPSIFSIGIESYNPYDGSCTIWNQGGGNPQNGAYYGYMGGRILENNTLEGGILALYLDQSGNMGILKGSFDGTLYPDAEMWDAAGGIYPVEIVQDTDFDASDLYPHEGGFIKQICLEGSAEFHGKFFNASNEQFGGDIYRRYAGKKGAAVKTINTLEIGGQSYNQYFSATSTIYGGTYTEFGGNTFDHWYLPFSFDDGTTKRKSYLLSSSDAAGSWSDNLISGKGVGAWVNLEEVVTGVCGADIKGTFNPDNATWQTAALWAGMDTRTFLSMADRANIAGQEKLAQLNIPCIEVGRTNLAGNNGNLYVNMNDTTFFAYSNGAPPRIWATGDVSGSYSSDPSAGTNVPLSGASTTCNINANFDVQKWDTNKWAAGVTGSGTVATHNINMTGSAAGQYGEVSGAFSGTGAGVASVPAD